MSLVLALALSAANAAEVRLAGERWWALRGPEDEAAPQPPGLVGVTSRTVRLEPTADGALQVRATWRVVAEGQAPVELLLSGTPGWHVVAATVDGRPAAVTSSERGLVWAGVPRASFTLSLTATLPADGHPDRAAFDLLPAGAGTIELPRGWTVREARFLGPGRLAGAPGTLSLAPAERPPSRGRLVLGEVGLGLTFGEEDLLVQGRLRWRVAGGSLSSVAFVLPGAGPDLQVSGPQVARWSRAGDLVTVDLLAEERGLVDLRVSTRAPLPSGEATSVAVPAIELRDVFRTTTSVELARDGTLDLVPHLPLEPAALAAVPPWGEGLVEGTPTAAFLGPSSGGAVEVLRFTPAESPATLVDVAAVTAAVSEDGHVLMRAHYAVRNDRGHVLRVTPPPGLEPVGVRVAGEAVTLARDGSTWLVPLRKSVESVQGLLSFGVEVTFLGTDAAWSRKDRRAFPLPSVDADVAVTRVTLHLPPGWRSRARAGEHEVVDAFTEGEGITYGFAVGDTRAAAADALFQEAVGAWMDNDFDAAQQKLDALKELGADNTDIQGLQGNVLVVTEGKDTSGGETALERRVLDQARARAEDERRQQQEVLLEAEEATRRGDYEQANEAYGQALELADKLGKLANAEDVAQDVLEAKVKEKVAENVDRKSKREAFAPAAQVASPSPTPVVVEAPPTVDVSSTPSTSTTEPFVEIGLEEPPPPEEPAEFDAEPAPPAAGPTATEGRVRLGVTDEAELPIPGATVTLEGESLIGGARSTSTGDDGTVVVPNLPQGSYDVTVDSPGFGHRTTDLEVVAGRTTAANVALPSGATEEVVVQESSKSPLRGFGGGGGSSAGKSAKKAAEPARPPPTTGVEVSLGSSDAPLAVTAAHASVVVPNQGEAVLYQHLLSPAGADLSVQVDARRARRTP